MPNWSDVLNEIRQIQAKHDMASRISQAQASTESAIQSVRSKYLTELNKYTGRNIIAYYSGFLSKQNINGLEITDEDKNGFMMTIHKMDRSKGLDLILHTPGGGIAAAESIANYLHQMFGGDIRAIVPQISMSAGTMLACACKTIILAKHSNLGPTDPHLAGIPALGVIEEFKRAAKEIKTNPHKAAVWQPILSKYHPTFLGRCEDAVKWSKEFVESELLSNMLKGKTGNKATAKRISKLLMDKKNNKSHERHLHLDELAKAGLVMEELEQDPKLQDLVLTVHHAYMHTLMNTNAFKIIENQLNTALIKNTTPNAA